MNMTAKAEWYTPETIIMHEPDMAAKIGVFSPESSLYQGPFDFDEALNEHRNLQRILKENIPNVKIELIRDVLKRDLSNNNNRQKLEELARSSIKYNYSGFDDIKKRQMINNEDLIFKNLSPNSLADMILLQPNITIMKTKSNTGSESINSIFPVYNMIFTRDQQIITDKGLVMANMNSNQRRIERDITTFVFEKLGVSPIYAVKGDGRLEGGDFIPAGKRAYIGFGERTNLQGILDLIENDVFDFEELVIVKNPKDSQDEMHLDTIFNVVSEDKYVLLEDMVDGGPKDTYVKVLRKNGEGNYVSANENIFKDQKAIKSKELGQLNRLKDYLLTHTDKKNIVTFSKQLQEAYAPNFLTIAPNKVIGIDIAKKDVLKNEFIKLEKLLGKKQTFFPTHDTIGNEINYSKLSDTYLEKLDSAGITYTAVDFNHMNMMYGGIHCCTQVSRIDINDKVKVSFVR